MTIQTNDNKFAVSKWIVDQEVGVGTHTDIASALSAASTGEDIFIRPGIYTENLTLKSGVNLVAFKGDELTPNVTIVGNSTADFTGNCSISNMRLETNGAPFLTVSGSDATVVNVLGCDLNMTDNDGIVYSSSSASSEINFRLCTGDLGTVGIRVFDHTSPGNLTIANSGIENSGVSVTASTITAGFVNIADSSFLNPITSSGTGGILSSNSTFSTPGVIGITAGGSGSHQFSYDTISTTTASAVSVSTSITLRKCSLLSDNVNIVAGAGTCVYQDITLGISTGLIAAGTNTGGRLYTGGISFDEGTHSLEDFTDVTAFTPVLEFGGGTTGITYLIQQGRFTRIGNLMFINICIKLTSKGSSVGVATITGLPLNVSNIETVWGAGSWSSIDLAANYTQVCGEIDVGTSVIQIVQVGDNVVSLVVDDTAFINTSALDFSGFYEV